MSATAITSILLGYEPIIDRNRRAIAMRLTPAAAAGESIDFPALHADLAEALGDAKIPVLLRTLAAESPEKLIPLAECAARSNIWFELSAGLVGSAKGLEVILRLHRRGHTLVLGGRPATPLPAPLLPAFRMSIIDVAEDRRLNAPARAPSSVTRSIPHAQAGVTTIEMLRKSFEAGAVACIGWPFQDALEHASSADSNPDFTTITQLLSMINQGGDPGDMEKVIRRDPALAYRLLRYINSPAFGLTVEVQSFSHAVMMLGYERLKRWLLLMLSTASKDANMRPVMFASFRRGLLLEQLVGGELSPAERDEIFILGVLSLIDKLFREPMPVLLEKLAVPESVRDALVDRTGALAPYLKVAEAVEQPPQQGLSRRLDDALLSVEQCNRALLRAISTDEVAND